MGQILAILKTTYGIIMAIKQIMSTAKQVYRMKLDHEKKKAKEISKETSTKIKKEISKKIADQSNAELKNILRNKLK